MSHHLAPLTPFLLGHFFTQSWTSLTRAASMAMSTTPPKQGHPLALREIRLDDSRCIAGCAQPLGSIKFGGIPLVDVFQSELRIRVVSAVGEVLCFPLKPGLLLVHTRHLHIIFLCSFSIGVQPVLQVFTLCRLYVHLIYSIHRLNLNKSEKNCILVTYRSNKNEDLSE